MRAQILAYPNHSRTRIVTLSAIHAIPAVIIGVPPDKRDQRIKQRLQQPLFMNVAALIVLAGDFQRFEPKLAFQLRADLNGGKS
jgi:hypothetical protein